MVALQPRITWQLQPEEMVSITDQVRQMYAVLLTNLYDTIWYDTRNYILFSHAQKLMGSQLNLPHETKKTERVMKKNKNKKPRWSEELARSWSPWSQSWGPCVWLPVYKKEKNERCMCLRKKTKGKIYQIDCE